MLQRTHVQKLTNVENQTKTQNNFENVYMYMANFLIQCILKCVTESIRYYLFTAITL